jgi:hypothetical protein
LIIDSTAIVSTIHSTWASEGWTCTEPRTPPPDVFARAITGPDDTVGLMVTHAPGQPLLTDLAGHRGGHPPTATWSLTITAPTETQRLATASASADDRLNIVVGLDGRLQEVGWELEADKPISGILFEMTSTHGRAPKLPDSTKESSDNRVLDTDGLHPEATNGVPSAVLSTLITAPDEETHLSLGASCRPRRHSTRAHRIRHLVLNSSSTKAVHTTRAILRHITSRRSNRTTTAPGPARRWTIWRAVNHPRLDLLLLAALILSGLVHLVDALVIRLIKNDQRSKR